MQNKQRLTRLKRNRGGGKRGQHESEYASDATRQELVMRLAEHENAVELRTVKPAAEEHGGGARSAEEADVLEAYRTGRVTIPLACATCGAYPDRMTPEAHCAQAGMTVRRMQYCGSWRMPEKKRGEVEA